MKFYAITAAMAVIVAGSFLACDKGSKEIKIGGVAPVTGEAATFGASTKNGMDLAVAEWNAKGGVTGQAGQAGLRRRQGRPRGRRHRLHQAHRAGQGLRHRRHRSCPRCSLAGAPICQAAKIPMIATTSTNPKVTQVGDYIFRACFIDPFQGTVGAKFAYEDLKAKKAACLFDVGNDYTKGLSEFFKAKFTALGGEISGFEGHATGTTDFKAQLTKILATKPDVLYVSDYYNDVALIAKQARELGFKGPLLGGDGWDSPKLVEVGGAAMEGCFFTNHNQDAAPADRDRIREEVPGQVRRRARRPGGAGL